MNKKIILSLSVIGVVAAIAIGGTVAYFSDTETSTGNTFTAGSLDLKVDSTCHYNGNVCASGVWTGNSPYPAGVCDCSWTLKDLTTERFFDLDDVKPGDDGESTISLHVYDNDAWGCVTITPTANHDNGLTGPESKVDTTDGAWQGELAQHMNFMIWADTCNIAPAVPGDNIYQPDCDKPLTQGTGPLAPITWALADSVTPNVFTGAIGPLVGKSDYYIGAAWNIPTTVGNIIQSDSYQADISFYTEQHRNNPNFRCVQPRTTQVQSSVFNFSGTGWAGWSCPSDYPNIVSADTSNCTLALGPSLAWEQGASVETFTYPTTPTGYTYATGEEGWILQNGGTSQSCFIVLTCQAN